MDPNTALTSADNLWEAALNYVTWRSRGGFAADSEVMDTFLEAADAELAMHEEPICFACGDHIDYCQGHGPMADPIGYRMLALLEGIDDDVESLR